MNKIKISERVLFAVAATTFFFSLLDDQYGWCSNPTRAVIYVTVGLAVILAGLVLVFLRNRNPATPNNNES